MAVILEIEDGAPAWWLSPNIWTVRDQPDGIKGSPIEGKPCYLWAKVKNKGEQAIENATVHFYWANPSTGFDRKTANFVGSSFVSLEASQTADVLCLTPWIPSFVNGGHECVLAEIFHPQQDPLPNTPAFNVPTDRHVAQRNLSVLKVNNNEGLFHFAFEIHNSQRKSRNFTIKAKQGNVAEIKDLLPMLSPGTKIPDKQGKIEILGFVPSACPDKLQTTKTTTEGKTLELKPLERQGLSVIGKLQEGGVLIHIVQEENGIIVGGLSFFATR